MTPSLEDRLAAAGEQLDALIERERPVMLGIAERPGRPRTVGVLVSLCTVVLVVVGLMWVNRSDDPTRTPATDTGAPLPTAPVTTTPPLTTVQTESSQTSVPTATSTPATPVPTVTPTTAAPDLVRPTDVSGLFVTVSADRPAVVDLRDATSVIGSFDLGCPTGRACVVASARVMGDTIWVAINDTDPDDPNNDIASRVLSVSPTTGEIVQHLGLRGTTTVLAAGRGADGVVYTYLSDELDGLRLVSIDDGDISVLETGVSGFLLSDDGRFLAVSLSNPPAGERPRIEVTDLADGSSNAFQTDGINAGPGAWSPDGRHLIVNEQWEDGTAWVVDPWATSPEPSAATGVFLDGACFIDAGTIAHRTWNVGYGQGDAQPGVIRLTAVDDGSTLADLGQDLFGDSLRCHPDGSVTYLRRPVADVDLGDGFIQPEPVYDAPVDLVRIAPDGSATTLTSGPLRMV
jgi:hypothetical protein